MAFAVTVPDQLEMLVGERLDCSWDFTNVIAAGDTCSSPTITIANNSTNEFVSAAVIGAVVILNNIVVKATITSTPLRPRTTYVCTITCTVTGGGAIKTISVIMMLRVIY